MYDLRCKECGESFEVFCQGFLKDDAKVCPSCGSREVEQKLSGFLTGTPGRSLSSGAVADGCGSHSFG